MTHNEQDTLDLREPIAVWLKVLCSGIAGLLLYFMVVCFRGSAEGADAFAVHLLVAAVMVALPAIPCLVMSLYFWWGKKYLVIRGNSLVIHTELFGVKRTRCMVVGRHSRLLLRRVTIHEPQDHGGCAEKLELHLTDTYGYSCRLLQFAMSEQERVLAISQEVCRRFPELKFVRED